MLDIVQFEKAKHFELVASWWKQAGEAELSPDLLPEDSTFILTAKGRPWISVTVFLTNSPELAWVENLVADPDMPGGAAREAGIAFLQKFLEQWAAKLGYRRLFAMTRHERLGKRYRQLGYQPSGQTFETFNKILK